MSLAKIFWFFLLFYIIRKLLSFTRVSIYRGGMRGPVQQGPSSKAPPAAKGEQKKTFNAEYKVLNK